MFKKTIFVAALLSMVHMAACAQEAKVDSSVGENKGETVFCELSCNTNKSTCLDVCEAQEKSAYDACSKSCSEAYSKCAGLCGKDS